MSAGFTPGPWEVRHQFIGPRLAVNSSIQVRVARVNDNYEDPEAEANARLIAAAPALYEALERIAEGPGPGSDYVKGVGEVLCSENEHMANIARAALKLARGEA